jgi:serine/threonine protein kinase
MICPNCSRDIDNNSVFCSGCGTKVADSTPAPAAPSMSPEKSDSAVPVDIDDVLMNRYQVKEALKRGGMGTVYKVFDLRLKRIWALKEMIESFINDDEKKKAAERFSREATILASLEHPNLPRVIDFFEERGRFYLVMDFIIGDDLQDVVKSFPGTRAPIPGVLKIANDILNVLSYLHGQRPPVIYRDIKPSNIMIRRSDKRIMLIDFGIARALSTQEFAKTEIGTVGYAPPEQYAGHAQPVSDIYALGATMHELLSGIPPRVPFQFQPLHEILPDIPPKLDSIIMKALEQETGRRWQSAAEMQKAIDDYNTSLRSENPPSQAALSIARALEPKIADLPGLETTSLSHAQNIMSSPGGAFSVAQSLQKGPDFGSSGVSSSFASLPAAKSSLTPPITPPSPTNLLGSEKEKALQNLHKYLQKFAEPKILEGHSKQVNSFAFHPTKEQIASASMDGTVRLWDLETGQQILSFSEQIHHLHCATFSFDGRHLAYCGTMHNMLIYDLRTKIKITEFDKCGKGISSIVYNPKDLIVYIGCNEGDIIIYNYAIQNFVRLKYNKIPVSSVAVSGDGTYLASGHRDGSLNLWDPSTKTLVASVKQHEGPIRCIAFAPNNKILASGSSDSLTLLWSVPKFSLVKSLRGSSEIYSLDFVRDHPYLCTSSSDRTIRFWDLYDGELNVFFKRELGLVSRIAYGVYGSTTYFVACTSFGLIYYWKL